MGSRQAAAKRAKRRRHNERLVLRAPDLSAGAKLLWLELCAWAWDEDVCYPSQELLQYATGASRYSISRWLRELQDNKLVTVERQQRGNRYLLVDEIPVEVCDPCRAINSQLVALARGKSHPESDVAEMPHGDAQNEKPCGSIDTSHVAEMPHDPPIPCSRNATWDVAEMPHHDDEVCTRKCVHEEEEEVSTREVMSDFQKGSQTRRKSVSDHGLIEEDEGNTAEESGIPGQSRTQVEDPSELMEEPNPERQRRRNKRRKNAADPKLVSTAGEGRRSSPQPPGATKSVEVSPPPPETPEDVLRLLRGEIEKKYGSKACLVMPHELTSKDRGMLRKVILKKFTSNVVIAMIRVLVWDWEVARSTCFPYRVQMPIPSIESLVQYQEVLSACVTTGLKYDGARRGEWITYASRYLKDASPLAEADPW